MGFRYILYYKILTFNLPDFQQKTFYMSDTPGQTDNGLLPNITGGITQLNSSAGGFAEMYSVGAFFSWNTVKEDLQLPSSTEMYYSQKQAGGVTNCGIGFNAYNANNIYNPHIDRVIPAHVQTYIIILY